MALQFPLQQLHINPGNGLRPTNKCLLLIVLCVVYLYDIVWPLVSENTNSSNRRLVDFDDSTRFAVSVLLFHLCLPTVFVVLFLAGKWIQKYGPFVRRITLFDVLTAGINLFWWGVVPLAIFLWCFVPFMKTRFQDPHVSIVQKPVYGAFKNRIPLIDTAQQKPAYSEAFGRINTDDVTFKCEFETYVHSDARSVETQFFWIHYPEQNSNKWTTRYYVESKPPSCVKTSKKSFVTKPQSEEEVMSGKRLFYAQETLDLRLINDEDFGRYECYCYHEVTAPLERAKSVCKLYHYFFLILIVL
jgi:hypothetical protein